MSGNGVATSLTTASPRWNIGGVLEGRGQNLAFKQGRLQRHQTLFMKSIAVLCLFVALVAAGSQDPPGITSGTFFTPAVPITTKGDNFYTLQFPIPFNSAPYFGLNVIKMTSSLNFFYILRPRIVSVSQTSANLNINTPANNWINLGFSWIASVSPALTVVQFSSYFPPNNVSTTQVFPASNINIPPGTVKVDTLIAGFFVQSSTGVLEFGVVPQPVAVALPSSNNNTDPGVTSTPFVGFFVQSGNSIALAYVVTYNPAIITSFPELVITLVIHSVAFPSGAQSPVTTGLNTAVVTQSTSYINIFNPIGNKNNLGVPTAQTFFGFNAISLGSSLGSPLQAGITSAIDILAIVNTPFNASIQSISKLNQANAAFYFYENNANSICPTPTPAPTPLISSTYNNWICRTVTNAQGSSTCQAYSGTSDTYLLSIANLVPASVYLDITTNIGTTYLVTFYVLDGGAQFASPQVTVKFGDQVISKGISTASNQWKSSDITTAPTAAQIQSINSYIKFSAYVVATQSVSRLQFEFADQTQLPTQHPYYLKAVSVTSGNNIYNPSTQMCSQSCFSNQMISTNTVPNVCTSCTDQGRVFDPISGACTCPVSTYFNPSTLTCVPCLEYSCDRCNVNNPTICTSCPVNRVPTANRCVCAPGFIEVNTTCVACNAGCSSCAITPTLCLSCPSNSNRVQSNGACNCITGFYDSGVPVCASCPVSCLTCTNANTAIPSPVCVTCPRGANRSPIPVNNDCPCLPGYIEFPVKQQSCQPCHFSCATCTGPSSNQCVNCDSNSNRVAIPGNGGLMCICAAGFNENGLPVCTQGASCATIPGCISCVGATCRQCDSTQNLVTDNSFTRCICRPGYFNLTTSQNGGAVTCSPCNPGCLSCTSSGVCTQCFSSAVLTTGGCQCMAGFFLDQASSSCSPCANGCQSCSSALSCNQCYPPLVLTQGNCACSQGFYQLGTTCQSCATSCQQCNSTTCLFCQPGYLINNGTCTNACPLGTYSNGFSCIPCSSGCLNCAGPNNCQVCTSGMILSFGACVFSCPGGSVVSITTPLTCLPCNTNCRTCSIVPTNCMSCGPGLFLSNSVCTPTCPTGTYASSGSCLPCGSGCGTCFSAPNICTSCSGTTPLLVLDNYTCTGNCPPTQVAYGVACYVTCQPQTFYSPVGCQPCSASCLTCSVSAGNCTSCPNNTYLQGSTCVSACTSGNVPVGRVCQPCDVSCSSCNFGAPFVCASCAPGYSASPAQAGLCIPTCIGNSFNNGTACQACPSSCAGCSNANYCLACASTTAILTNGQCSQCASPCLTCTVGSSTTCLTCMSGTSLSGSICVSVCPINQSPINGLCKCTSGFAYQSGCVSQCPASTTLVGSVCQPCTANCYSCSGTPTTCVQCAIGFTLSSGNCIQSSICSYGQVPDSTNNNLCVNICPSSLLFYDTYCVSSCPTNFIPNPARSGCVVGNSSTGTTCGVGLFFFNGVCLATCPVGTFGLLGSCINCPQNCGTCSSSSVCQTCLPSFFLNNGLCVLSNACVPPQISFQGGCVTTCPAGTYQSGQSCNVICPTGTYFYNGLCYYQACPVGTFKTAYSCVTQCPSGTTASNGSCIGTTTGSCPTGSYLTQSGGCAACQTPCASCFSTSTTCTSCVTGTLSGTTCSNNGGGTGTIGLTIQSSSIFNNQLSAKVLLSNVPSNLNAVQQSQLLNVVIFPAVFPQATVYQWITGNVVNVVVIFPGTPAPGTTVYFSINVAAVGPAYNQMGISNFANANAQLPTNNVPQGSATFAIPSESSPTLATAPVSTRAN